MQTPSLGPMIWKDMRVNVWTGNANWANQKIKQFFKVSALCLDDHQFKNEGLETVGDLSNIGPQIDLNCLYLALIGRSDIFCSGNYLARATTH